MKAPVAKETPGKTMMPVMTKAANPQLDAQGGQVMEKTLVKKSSVTYSEEEFDRFAMVYAEAKMKGYEGDPCSECGALTLVRNGSCLKCDSCGATTGCS